MYRFPVSSLVYARVTREHDQYVSAHWQDVVTQAASPIAHTHYSTSYYLSGLCNAAEGTDDDDRYRQVMALVDTMLLTTAPLMQGQVIGWGPGDINGNPDQLSHFMAMVPIARLSALILRDPRRSRLAEFVDRARVYAAFCDQMVRYWVTTVYGGLIPWLAKPDGWGTYIRWSDKCTLLGNVCVGLTFGTGEPYHRSIAQKILTGLQTRIKPLDTAGIWDQDVTPNDAGQDIPTSPDTSHANREPLLLLRAYEAGFAVSADTLQRVNRLFLDRIWNKSRSSPAFTNYIDGSNGAYQEYPEYENGTVYAGWTGLASVSWEVCRLVGDVLTAIAEGRMNSSLVRNATSFGLIELRGRLLHATYPAYDGQQPHLGYALSQGTRREED